jgi:CRISPR-associated endonuclease/helicase Cas3
MTVLYAKSPTPDFPSGETLIEHTDLVCEHMDAWIERLKTFLSPQQILLFQNAAAFHDIGKSAPWFQAKLRGKPSQNYRHEIFSLAWIHWISQTNQLPSELDLTSLLLLVAVHHRLPGHTSFRSALDILYYTGEEQELLLNSWVPDNYQADIETTQLIISERVNWVSNLSLPTVKQLRLSLLQALQIVENQLVYLQDEGSDQFSYLWLLQRGLFRLSDHGASAHSSSLHANPLAYPPGWNFPVRSHQAACAKEGSRLLIAPTGAGKTEAALIWASCQLTFNSPTTFFLLPYKAANNAMWDRMVKETQTRLGCNENEAQQRVGLHHSNSLAKLSTDIEKQPDQQNMAIFRKKRDEYRLFVPALHISTPYQLLKSFFSTSSSDISYAGMANGHFIVDEIHAYDPDKFSLILAMLEYFQKNSQATFVMTATLPAPARRLIQEVL